MKNYFPPKNQNYTYLQTNRSDDLGSLWSTFNLDFQSNLGTMRLAQKLVTNTTSSQVATMGLPVAYEFWYDEWWAIAGTRLYKNGSPDATVAFAEDTVPGYNYGASTSQFDITNPAGTTFRYTWDGGGADPGITALTFPVGAIVTIDGGVNFAPANQGVFTITGSGANFFEVTNASGVVESNKTLGGGHISVSGGPAGKDFSTVVSDMKVFNNRLWTTSTTKLRSRTGDTIDFPWVDRATLANPSVPHVLLYFKKFNRLYFVSDNAAINSIDTSDVVATPGSDYAINPEGSAEFVSSMVATSGYIWIGTFRDNTTVNARASQTKGSIMQWDGFSAQITNEFPIEASGVIAMVVIGDVPYAIDTEGRILKFTGYAFEEVQRLPIVRTLLTNTSATATNKFIHFNGMVATKNRTILININNLNQDAQSDVTENLQSGVWEYDIDTSNLTHRYSPTLKSIASTTVSDYGQSRISLSGALKMNTLQSSSSSGRPTILAGYNYYTDATTIKSGIYVDSPDKPTTNTEGQKRGYFVTTWFYSDEIQDKWTRLWTTFRKFQTTTDKIIFKYRLNEEEATLANITWTSTTTFTTTTDVSAYAATATGFNGTTGGEVEILQGTGSGACVHITTVVNNAGTYTVTLDTAVPNVTGTAKARFQKWIKLNPTVIKTPLSYEQMGIGSQNIRIQIKGVLEWTGDMEFYKIAIWSNEDIKINP